jgi:hypothetical protein
VLSLPGIELGNKQGDPHYSWGVDPSLVVSTTAALLDLQSELWGLAPLRLLSGHYVRASGQRLVTAGYNYSQKPQPDNHNR